MVRAEWKRLLHNKILLIVLIAIIAIPTIYTTLFLGSMWDPYGELSNLPVAVVNHDQPVTYNGKRLAVGETLISNLKDNGSLDFCFVGQDEANAGLSSGKYYMVINIPANFSSNASTLFDEAPKKMELDYETNPGTNYIASKMSDSALAKIRSSISEEVTKEYTRAVFDEISVAGSGMQEAADGAKSLDNGAQKAADGGAQLEKNLKKFSSSALSFRQGSKELTVGIQKYTKGVSDADSGAKQLASGLYTLLTSSSQGTGELFTGADSLLNGVQQYTSGVEQAQAGAAQLAASGSSLVSGVSQAAAGMAQVKSGADAELAGLQTLSSTLGAQMTPSSLAQLTAVQQGLTALNGSIQSLAAGMSQLAATASSMASPSSIEALTTQLNALNASMQAIAAQSNALLPAGSGAIANLEGGLAGVKTALDKTGSAPADMGLIQGMKSVDGGLLSLSSGLTRADGLANGVKSYTDGVSRISSGLTTLNTNSPALLTGAVSLKNGVAELSGKLSDGITQLRDGADQLAFGTGQLLANSGSLVDGALQLQNGAVQFQSGSKQLYQGSQTLDTGLNDLADGTKTLSSSLADGAASASSLKTDDRTVSMFAAPVETQKTEASSVLNNGHAMAAYMMSVALWVGCIAFCLMYPLNKYEGTLKSGVSWWLSKVSVAYFIAIAQAVIMVLLLMHFNGFAPADLARTFLIACTASVAFMSIMYYFNALMGKVGSFAMLIFMVIQLAGSAGTYPLEISGSLAPKLHPYLPFSYTVSALRKTISGAGSIGPEMAVLAGLILVFSLSTLWLFHRRAARLKSGKRILLQRFEKAEMA